MLAGFYRGWVDSLLSRVMDVVLAFPILLLALGLAASCTSPTRTASGLPRRPDQAGRHRVVIIVIVIATWPYFARIVRGQVLSLREKEFVESARSLGASNSRIMFREILPNLVDAIIVYATLLIPAEHPLRSGAVVPRRRRRRSRPRAGAR